MVAVWFLSAPGLTIQGEAEGLGRLRPGAKEKDRDQRPQTLSTEGPRHANPGGVRGPFAPPLWAGERDRPWGGRRKTPAVALSLFLCCRMGAGSPGGAGTNRLPA